MYEQFFGLSENPFSLTPDPRFIYSSRSHDEALAHLRYWVEHREGFAMITGEVGTGKTTALFRLIEGMAKQYEIAFITNSTLTPVDLLEDICRKFHIDLQGDFSKPVLLQKLEATLVRLNEMEHGAILIIDEAQNFDHSLLEEVRLLSNITKQGGPPLLQIALVGQPELERKLSLPELRQLKQRIGVHYRIEPLSEPETTHYIHHRVQVAGGYPRVLFPAETVALLHEKTHGLPREINQVASQSLLGAYVEDSTSVRPDHVRSAIREMNFQSVLDSATASTVTPPVPSVLDITPERQSAIGRSGRETPPVETRPVQPTVSPIAPVPIPEKRRPDPVVVPRVTKPVASTSPSGEAPAASPRAPRQERRFDPVLPSGAAPVQYGSGKKGPGRLVILIGTLVIVSLAAYLAFGPKELKRDELNELATEATLPKAPKSELTGRPAGEMDPMNGPDVIVETGASTTPPSVNRSGPPALAASTGDTTAKPVEAAAVAPPAPVPSTTVPPNRAFRLQVASLRDSTTAQAVGRQAEAASGWSFSVARSRQGELTWYAVLVGQFASRAEAEAARTRLGELDRQLAGAIIREPR